MAHSHVGHNCQVGDHVILANAALLGGHVEVGDRVNLGGNAVVHQFVRIGPLAMMQGGAAISLDLAPYTVSRKENRLAGLNTIGLRRAGLTNEERLELRRLYHLLFLGERGPQAAVPDAEREVRSEWGRKLVQFVATSQKGLVRPLRKK
jgi:UDP-N-acetylglucosamine acyltransferase